MLIKLQIYIRIYVYVCIYIYLFIYLKCSFFPSVTQLQTYSDCEHQTLIFYINILKLFNVGAKDATKNFQKKLTLIKFILLEDRSQR